MRYLCVTLSPPHKNQLQKTCLCAICCARFNHIELIGRAAEHKELLCLRNALYSCRLQWLYNFSHVVEWKLTNSIAKINLQFQMCHTHKKSTRERERINQKFNWPKTISICISYMDQRHLRKPIRRLTSGVPITKNPLRKMRRLLCFCSNSENISFVCVKKLIFLWLKRENNCSFRSPCHALLLRKFWVLRGFSILFDRTTTRYISHIVCVCFFVKKKQSFFLHSNDTKRLDLNHCAANVV